MDIGPTGYVVLGMLRLGERTGYEIKQLVDRSTRFFWAASYGQIYPELKKLEDAGLISGAADPQGGRQRRAYALTAAGEQALEEWLRDTSELGMELRDPALLKLFFADAIGSEDAAAIARAARERHEATVAALEEVRRTKPESDNRMPATVLEFGLDFHRWCTERFARMEQELKEKD
jgi:PadR family transcriptional regulator, regulatory protein AphA